jgi:hypothetical protein
VVPAQALPAVGSTPASTISRNSRPACRTTSASSPSSSRRAGPDLAGDPREHEHDQVRVLTGATSYRRRRAWQGSPVAASTMWPSAARPLTTVTTQPPHRAAAVPSP